jgi:Uma2 family endonuclease
VICDPLEFDDEHRDSVLNPAVLFEVLSKSTEAYDRGKKANHYRRIESLQEYVLVAHDEPRLEHYRRNDDGSWTLTEASGLDQALHLPALGIALPLRDVYDKVDFSQPEPE